MAILTLVGCGRSDSGSNAGPSTAPQPLQVEAGLGVVVVDAAHLMEDESRGSKPYLLQACQGIVLDARSFTFRDRGKLGRVPNAVQVLYQNGKYASNWPEFGMQVGTLNSSTLMKLKGEPFAGFAKGQHAFIAIGCQTLDSQTNRAEFEPFWAASVVFY